MTIIEFWAPWCAPCKRLQPVLRELADEYGATLNAVNVDEQPNLAARMNIRHVPTVVVEHNGQQVGRLDGSVTRFAVRTLLEAA